MAPLPVHRYPKRTSSGTTFTVVFCVVAVCVLIACAIWGFVIPKWRKKHPASPSRTKWNEGSILTARRKRARRKLFASKISLARPSPAQILPTYNPRVESPFPTRPSSSTEHDRNGLVTRTHSAYTAPLPSVSSNGLFTPVRHDQDAFQKQYHTVPRAIPAKHNPLKSSDFGDAKDFILAVPEPLTLRPREAGRPPAVARHLEKYGTPYSSSPANSDKLPHPNKLFKAIQTPGIRDSLCSSTSLRLDHRASDAAAASALGHVSTNLEEAIDEDGNSQHRSSSRFSNFVGQTNDTLRPCATLADLHRLHSYRSLTGSQPQKLARSGTITKPKTPIHSIRKLYQQDNSPELIPMISLPQIETSSTLFTMDESASEYGTMTTPATSPSLGPSRMHLIPDPLRPQKSFEKTFCSHVHPKTLNVVNQVDTSHKAVNRNSRGFFQPGRRAKAAPPSIHVESASSPMTSRQSRRSLSEIGNAIIAPVKGQLRSRMRASSMYSRDTHGFSLAATPVSPELPSPMVNIFADPDVAGNPFETRESVRTRIHKWHQKIESNSVTPTTPFFKQTSPVLPTIKTPTLKTQASGPELRRPDELAIEARRQVKSIAPAPGGAVWI